MDTTGKNRLEQILELLADGDDWPNADPDAHVTAELTRYAIQFANNSEQAITGYPKIAAHLAICDDCLAIFEDYLEMLQADQEDPLPVDLQPFDMSRLQQPSGISLEEGDAILLPEEQRGKSLFEQLPFIMTKEWQYQHTLPSLSGVAMSSGAVASQGLLQVAVPELGETGRLSARIDGTNQIALQLESDLSLKGRQIELYELHLREAPLQDRLIFRGEATMRAMGRAQFSVPHPGYYLLVLPPITKDEDPIPLALITPKLWEAGEA